MKLGRCLSLSLFLVALSEPLRAQSAAENASSDSFRTWALLSTPSTLNKTKTATAAKTAGFKGAGPETTQSIPRQPAPAAASWEQGWNLSSDETNASLVYAPEGKTAPVGFTCKKGDGFVTFRSPPSGFAAGKRMLVLLKSKNGSIRIDAHVSAGKTIESESPVRTSSLVFVLTPKIDPNRSKRKKDAVGQGAKLTVGGWSTALPESLSDVKLLRFQTLCDQPLASAE